MIGRAPTPTRSDHEQASYSLASPGPLLGAGLFFVERCWCRAFSGMQQWEFSLSTMGSGPSIFALHQTPLADFWFLAGHGPIDREVAVRRQSWKLAGPRAWSSAWPLGVLLAGLSGCAAVKQDVYQYYCQMARNYHEAEQKAKFDAIALEAKSRGHLQAGEIHQFKRSRRELARIKDWEARCAARQERFEQAARKLESVMPSESAPAPEAARPIP